MFIRLMRRNSVVLMVTKDRVGQGAVPMLLHGRTIAVDSSNNHIIV